ncbi:MAG: exodeoxyribonuclease VII large subunit [Dehalococcoidia bacterium]|nr:exodeoxyribonuclease VII large subunit [Dehalococcoidia bacterium]
MPVYTVSQISRYLKESLEGDPLLGDLWNTGEISNFRPAPSGHSYFTLKDAQGQLRSVMFKGGRGSELLESGVLVTAHGRISFYEARGDVQLVADLVMPEGTGPLHLQLEKLKMQLEEEGLFELSRKRSLPPLPRTIGVVTSPTGAVFHDICNIIGRRFPLVEILLAPATVQGESAAPAIVAAIKALNEQSSADIIILARGGGSLEELWPFNEEQVARGIYGSRIPVVSAVGHETDFTIADYVADLRASTPSAAAEMVVPDRRAIIREVFGREEEMERAFKDLVSHYRGSVESLAVQALQRTPDFPTWRRRVDDLARAAATPLWEHLTSLKYQVTGFGDQLKALNPNAILERGYAVVETQPEGRIVRSSEQVRPGQQLKLRVAEGSIPAVVGSSGEPQRQKKQPERAGAPLI